MVQLVFRMCSSSQELVSLFAEVFFFLLVAFVFVGGENNKPHKKNGGCRFVTSQLFCSVLIFWFLFFPLPVREHTPPSTFNADSNPRVRMHTTHTTYTTRTCPSGS